MGWRARIRKDRVVEQLEIGIAASQARERLRYELDYAMAKLGPADVAAVIAVAVPYLAALDQTERAISQPNQ